MMKALAYAYRDRRNRKRDMRSLWITRINAAARLYGMPYRDLIHGLTLAGVKVNRKVMADMAVRDLKGFGALVSAARWMRRSARRLASSGEGRRKRVNYCPGSLQASARRP